MLAWPISSRPCALVPTIQTPGGLFSPTMAAPVLSSSVISTSSLLTAWAPAYRCRCYFACDVLARFCGQWYRAKQTIFTYAFSALKAVSIIMDVAAKARAVLQSAVAAAETVHEGNAYMIFQAICTAGPAEGPGESYDSIKACVSHKTQYYARLQTARRGVRCIRVSLKNPHCYVSASQKLIHFPELFPRPLGNIIIPERRRRPGQNQHAPRLNTHVRVHVCAVLLAVFFKPFVLLRDVLSSIHRCCLIPHAVVTQCRRKLHQAMRSFVEQADVWLPTHRSLCSA
eukprot:354004-Chlamydomonas_euryale.AAC.4